MKFFTIYEISTGRIVGVNNCPGPAFRPKEGPLPDDPNLAVKHGKFCPTNDRIENGRVVPVGMQTKFKMERLLAWNKFKKRRREILSSKDYLLAPHYPLTDEKRSEILEKFQQSRDIPKEIKDPHEALLILEQIWRS